MPESTENKNLNPRIASIEIGVRYLRNVTFYPLSAAHQLEMTDILQSIFNEMFALSGNENQDEALGEFVAKVFILIKANIKRFVEMITDEDPDKFLADLDNEQLTQIVEYIYKTNFEGPLKNLLSLFQKEEGDMKELVLNQLLPRSVKSTATSLNTSIDEVSEMEDSPSDK